MFVLVAALQLLDRFSSSDAAAAGAEHVVPALQFINRWMPLFYSPLLVALPLNASGLIGLLFCQRPCFLC